MELDHIDYILYEENISEFIDIKFPPTIKSIYGETGTLTGRNPLKKVSVTWRRAGEIFGKGKYKVFD